MKKILFVLSIIAYVTLTACSNDDDQTPLEQLPPATQTGKRTFGCLINGKAFIPDNSRVGRPNAFYQFVDGKYTLGISASNGRGGPNFESIGVAGLEVPLVEEQSYLLKEEKSGGVIGRYLIGGGLTLNAITSSSNSGILTITKLDEENGIIAGTFEFTVLDNDGNEIRITNGRFDLPYTN